MGKEKKFAWVNSKSCFKVKDIQGIIFGATSSRFWMLRKHLIENEKYTDEKHIPFYSWECITIQFAHRDLDLVIRS